MLQYWGSDRAVQSQRCLPLSLCHLTSPPFHCNHLILAIVCISSTVIASPSHCNATSSLLYIYPLILSWWLDYEHSAVTLPTLWQDYQHTAGKTSVVFENPHSTRRQDCEHGTESTNDDRGTGTTCEFVKKFSLQLVIVAPSSMTCNMWKPTHNLYLFVIIQKHWQLI